MLNLYTSDNKIISKHYKKPTFTGRIIHNLSNQPFQCKINTAINLKERWLSLSDPTFHFSIMDELENLLAENSYSFDFIKRVFNFRRTDNDTNMVGKHGRRYFSLPYTWVKAVLSLKSFWKNWILNYVLLLKIATLLTLKFSLERKIKFLNTKSRALYMAFPAVDAQNTMLGKIVSFSLRDCPNIVLTRGSSMITLLWLVTLRSLIINLILMIPGYWHTRKMIKNVELERSSKC